MAIHAEIQSTDWLSVKVDGRPRHVAALLQEDICRFCWVAAVGIPLWIAVAIVLNTTATHDFMWAAKSLPGDPGHNVLWIINAPIAMAIVGISLLFLACHHPVSIRGGYRLAMIAAATTMLAKSLHVGFSHIHPNQVITLDLIVLITFAISPLRLVPQFLLLLVVILLPVPVALMTDARADFEAAGAHGLAPIWFLINPMAFGLIGVILNRRYVRQFKVRRLQGLRLERHRKQLGLQKVELEFQRAEADRQRDLALEQRQEAQKQQAIAIRALSSAMTEPIAREYLANGSVQPSLKSACVIACDAKQFSETCRKLPPESIVYELERFFMKFDMACFENQVEPLRATGDSRLAIAGLWSQGPGSLPRAAIGAVLAMLTFRQALPSTDPDASDAGRNSESDSLLWPARIGIHCGPVCMGVIDTAHGRAVAKAQQGAVTNGSASTDVADSRGRLWFDVWGDTVNVAARLEQGAKTNQILVTESLLWQVRGLFDYSPIQMMNVKNTSIPACASITGIKAEYQDESGQPNDDFWAVFHNDTFPTVRPLAQGTRPTSTSMPEPAAESDALENES